MKRVTQVSLGGRVLMTEEDAWATLDLYLRQYRRTLLDRGDTLEALHDVEIRIGEWLWEWRAAKGLAVRIEDVERAISQMGAPEGSTQGEYAPGAQHGPQRRKLYRDGQRRTIGGVCRGLAYYFSLDVALVRLLFVVALIFAFSTFWIYIILWIALPKTKTLAQRLEMQGLPLTPENLQAESALI